MLKRSKELIQAYKETPWRRQMQMISFVAGVVVVLALIAAVYLNITARSATTGRLVQQLQSERADLEQHIEDMRTQLAFILSVEQMQKRAGDLGFKPVAPAAITYVAVAEYRGRPVGVELAPRAGREFGPDAPLPAAYTNSLFDWLAALFADLGGY
ncbi:MAG TPA: hypothetical protein VI703_06180 [Anaerolineales bacterium]|jgi:hypothetical protein|nr:hypothetical protein [Anaerolineales bacterium]